MNNGIIKEDVTIQNVKLHKDQIVVINKETIKYHIETADGEVVIVHESVLSIIDDIDLENLLTDIEDD